MFNQLLGIDNCSELTRILLPPNSRLRSDEHEINPVILLILFWIK